MTDYRARDIEDGMVPADTRRWYNRSEQAWVVQLVTAEGYQIGEALYIGQGNGGKTYAIKAERELREEFGL